MKLLVLCAVLSLCVAVSLAVPAKTRIRDADDSSASEESSELKISGKSSSSSAEENEQTQVLLLKAKVANEESDSSDVSEEEPAKTNIVKDENNEINSIEEEVVDDSKIIRAKRAVNYRHHPNNQLVKDKDSLKHEKFLKLKRLRRTLGNINNRVVRNADTSEENSSEEDKHGNGHAAHEHSAAQPKGVLIAKKPETAPAETLDVAAKADTAPAESEPQPSARRRRYSPSSDSSEEDSSEEKKTVGSAGTHNLDEGNTTHANTEGSRRRRSAEASSEQDQSAQAADKDEALNEVFFFSKEQEKDFEENLNSDHLKNNEYVVLKDTNVDKSDLSVENKDSEEDYAKGCGGNRDDDSEENSNENNEILNDKL